MPILASFLVLAATLAALAAASPIAAVGLVSLVAGAVARLLTHAPTRLRR